MLVRFELKIKSLLDFKNVMNKSSWGGKNVLGKESEMRRLKNYKDLLFSNVTFEFLKHL